MTFNQKNREFETICENRRSREAEEDEWRMEGGEDIEYQFSLDWYDEQVRKINKLTKELGGGK